METKRGEPAKPKWKRSKFTRVAAPKTNKFDLKDYPSGTIPVVIVNSTATSPLPVPINGFGYDNTVLVSGQYMDGCILTGNYAGWPDPSFIMPNMSYAINDLGYVLGCFPMHRSVVTNPTPVDCIPLLVSGAQVAAGMNGSTPTPISVNVAGQTIVRGVNSDGSIAVGGTSVFSQNGDGELVIAGNNTDGSLTVAGDNNQAFWQNGNNSLVVNGDVVATGSNPDGSITVAGSAGYALAQRAYQSQPTDPNQSTLLVSGSNTDASVTVGGSGLKALAQSTGATERLTTAARIGATLLTRPYGQERDYTGNLTGYLGNPDSYVATEGGELHQKLYTI